MFVSLALSACAYKTIRDFPQTKLDNEINAPFLLKELGDPRFFVLVFAKNSLIKNIFIEGKSLIVEHDFFFFAK